MPRALIGRGHAAGRVDFACGHTARKQQGAGKGFEGAASIKARDPRLV
nr:J477 [uncultured bacterium]